METASYRIKVRTGPSVTMEVMQQGAIMTMMDQGLPVNHHVEVHIFDRSSGAEVKTMIPVVAITQQGAAISRSLPNVKACLLANHRVTEPHFGDNMYLPDGSYTFAVGVGNETAVFSDMVVRPAG